MILLAQEIVTAMSVESLIQDLAFILILGAGITVLFKWIKQPVVLGYIVAGQPPFHGFAIRHYSGKHRVLGTNRYHNPPFFIRVGVQFQETAECGQFRHCDRLNHRNRHDDNRLRDRSLDGFQQYKQSFPGQHALHVVHHYYHQGIQRLRVATKKVCLAGICGFDSRRPLCGAYDGASLLRGNQQRHRRHGNADEYRKTRIFPHNMVSHRRLYHTVHIQ